MAYRHKTSIDLDQGWLLGQVFYIITCTLGRLSIAITLLRIAVGRVHKLILYAVILLSTAVGIVFLFFTIFQCTPVDYYWNRLTMPHGHCININSLLGVVYMYSGVAAACDFTMGFLPVFIIRNLQMNRRVKFAVSGLLGIACVYVPPQSCGFETFHSLIGMTCSASTAVIVRIPFLHYAASSDFLCSFPPLSFCFLGSDNSRYNNPDINLVQYRGKPWHYRRKSHSDAAPISSLPI